MTDLKKITTGYTISQHPEPCIGKDPQCPCQDGDACHYKDCGGTKALPVPAAQPAQKPVAWEHHEYRPYGAPGEIRIHAILASQYMMPDGSVAKDFQWLVDQYKADKNTIKLFPLYATPPAAQPEPTPWRDMIVATLVREGIDKHRARELADHFAAQRPWVGLTPEEILDLFDRNNVYGSKWIEFARAIEAALRSKNK